MNPRRNRYLYAFLGSFLISVDVSQAQEYVPPPQVPAQAGLITPFVDWYGRMHGYTYNNQPLIGYQSYEDVIFPLNDPTATNDLKRSEDEAGIGMAIGVGAGLVALVGMATIASEFSQSMPTALSAPLTSTALPPLPPPPNITTGSAILAAGLGMGLVSIIVFDRAGEDLNRSVDRYNDMVQGDPAPLSLVPSLNVGNSGVPGAQLTLRF